LVKQFDESQWPRAALAVDTKQITPVNMQAPTLIAAEDPYNAVGSTFKPKATGTPPEKPPASLDPQKPVKRALPVVPAPDGAVPVRRAQPVRPIDEAGTQPLLQSQPPPPPLDFSDGDQ
jgi:hypothetical protein